MPTTRDKNGREFQVGDVLRVYHFTAALRRKKHFMYKQIVGIRVLGKNNTPYFDVSHLSMNEDQNYLIGKAEGLLTDYEIVQGLDDIHVRPKLAP